MSNCKRILPKDISWLSSSLLSEWSFKHTKKCHCYKQIKYLFSIPIYVFAAPDPSRASQAACGPAARWVTALHLDRAGKPAGGRVGKFDIWRKTHFLSSLLASHVCVQ